MKHLRYIPVLIAAVLLSGCNGGSSISSAVSQTDLQAPGTSEFTASVTEEPAATAETAEPAPAQSAEPAEPVVWSTDELDCGGSERFYITSENQELYIGTLWFENSGGARELYTDLWYSEPAVYECGGMKILILDECRATSSTSHAFTVVDGDVYEIPIKGFAKMRLTPDGDRGFTALSSEFEGCMAHTWKPYWYTFSADGPAFVPVGGQAADVSALPQDVTDKITRDGGAVRTVIEFDNGITAVNYVTEEYGTEFQYHRLYDNGTDITPEDDRGHYKLPQ